MFPEWLLGMLAGAVGSTVIWLILGPIMSGKGLERWVKAAKFDENKRETLFLLFDHMILYATTREIKTGKHIKMPAGEAGDDGVIPLKDVPEVLTPIQLIAQTVGNFVIMKVKGQAGGVKSQLGRVLSDEAASIGGLSSSAAKALVKGQLGPALMELAMPYIAKRLNKTSDIPNISGENKW